MKNDIGNFLNQIGIVWKYLVDGLVGAAVWSLYKKLKFWDAIRQIIVGGIVSGFSTAFIIKEMNLSLETAGFISFTVGIVGMLVIDAVYKWMASKIKLLFS